ncbi:hypothetical protein [Nonomuraea sp. NPDC050786]|uniref:hypothetical protein n=1 Tax=Nonomuraea sp. NPDC050786 TaxID=3154840 RepID=UPI0033C4279E
MDLSAKGGLGATGGPVDLGVDLLPPFSPPLLGRLVAAAPADERQRDVQAGQPPALGSLREDGVGDPHHPPHRPVGRLAGLTAQDLEIMRETLQWT